MKAKQKFDKARCKLNTAIVKVVCFSMACFVFGIVVEVMKWYK